MPAIAPVEMEACECRSWPSADTDEIMFSADEVKEVLAPEDCELAVAAMPVSVCVICADEEASCGVLWPGSKTYFAFWRTYPRSQRTTLHHQLHDASSTYASRLDLSGDGMLCIRVDGTHHPPVDATTRCATVKEGRIGGVDGQIPRGKLGACQHCLVSS